MDDKKQKRIRRHKKIRSRIIGTGKVPRLSVFRSNKYIYAQLIDDDKGVTLAAVSGMDAKGENKTKKAKEIGVTLAKEAKKKKIDSVVFDRGGFIFAGRVKALAEGAREAGLKF